MAGEHLLCSFELPDASRVSVKVQGAFIQHSTVCSRQHFVTSLKNGVCIEAVIMILALFSLSKEFCVISVTGFSFILSELHQTLQRNAYSFT